MFKIKKQKYKWVMFDFGGVLGTDDDDFDVSFKGILDITGLDREEIFKIWENHWPDMKIGLKPVENFWYEIIASSKNDLNVKLLEDTYIANIKGNEKSLKFAQLLKNKGNNLAILANSSREWFKIKKERLNLEMLFDKIYNSGEIGLAKPDKRVYEYVIEDLRVKPKEVLFIDNYIKNLLPAEEMGFGTLLYTDELALEQNVEKILGI